MSTSKVAIIGFSGRNPGPHLTSALFDQACQKVRTALAKLDGVKTLVSGGSAWMDHVAVVLSAELGLELELYLPADFEEGQFVPCPTVQFNPGKRLNQLHRRFSRRTGRNSLQELATCAEAWSIVPGFHARNRAIATASQFCLAVCLGDQLSAGTKYTWDRFKPSQRLKINLLESD